MRHHNLRVVFVTLVLFVLLLVASLADQRGAAHAQDSQVPTPTSAPAQGDQFVQAESSSGSLLANIDTGRGFDANDFRAAFYDGEDLTGFLFTRDWASSIDFYLPCFGEVYPWLGCKLIPELSDGAGYSVRWQGGLLVPADGVYVFSLANVDDGARLYLDGNEIVDQGWYWPSPDLRPSPQSLLLTSGRHDIIVDFEQRPPFAAGLQVRWSGPTFGDEVVPVTGTGSGTLHDFKQNRNADGSKTQWADQHLYDINACGSMARYGCAITSMTDILASFGLQTLPNGASLAPGALNQYLGLSTNMGTHSNCNIIWAPAGRAVNYTIHDYRPPTTSYNDRIARIDEALNANNLVIVGIPHGGGKHFMVLYEKAPNAPDGSPDYFILDPYRYPPYATGDRSGKTLFQAYTVTLKQIASRFQIEVVENNAPQPGRSWAIVAHSPVEMLITDPNGAQTGFDPDTGSYVLNIPTSSYGPGDSIEDDTVAGPAIPDVLYFGQDQLEDGVYTLQVIGVGSGPYTLDFAVASGPMDGAIQTVAGSTAPGQTDTYTISVSEGEPLVVQRNVNIDIKPGSEPNCFNNDGHGVIPVAVLTTDSFDASSVHPFSLSLDGAASRVKGKSGSAGSLEDVDLDGDLDLVVQIEDIDGTYQEGNSTATLTGMTYDGALIVGQDSICIVPQ